MFLHLSVPKGFIVFLLLHSFLLIHSILLFSCFSFQLLIPATTNFEVLCILVRVYYSLWLFSIVVFMMQQTRTWGIRRFYFRVSSYIFCQMNGQPQGSVIGRNADEKLSFFFFKMRSGVIRKFAGTMPCIYSIYWTREIMNGKWKIFSNVLIWSSIGFK